MDTRPHGREEATMLLGELVAAPGLGLRVLHAPEGALERPVGRPITIDLLEPGRYLTGGERRRKARRVWSWGCSRCMATPWMRVISARGTRPKP